jgi:flagellar motor switch protein FliG
MHEALLGALTRNPANDSNVRIADILNRMERELIDGILSDFESARPKTAKALKRLLFRFEDIGKLEAKARTAVFDQVPAEHVVQALKGTDKEFQELLLSSLPARSRRMVESELGQDDEPNARAVTDARRAIVDRIMEMAGKGEIEINSSENEEE